MFNSEYYLDKIFFVDNEVGFAFGQHVFRSDNGGNSWERIYYTNMFDGIKTLFFVKSNTGWIGLYSGEIYKTIDGGDSWFLQNHPAPLTSVGQIFFVIKNGMCCEIV